MVTRSQPSTSPHVQTASGAAMPTPAMSAEPTTVEPLASVPLGELVNRIRVIDQQLAELTTQEKLLKQQREQYECNLIQSLDAQKTDRTAGTTHSAVIKTAHMFSVAVENWPAVVKLAAKRGLFHMLYRRVSNPVCAEQLELGNKLPGVDSFAKRTIVLHALSRG